MKGIFLFSVVLVVIAGFSQPTQEQIYTGFAFNPLSLSTGSSESEPISPLLLFPEEPAECKRPSDNYSIQNVNNHRLNQRTVDMLTYAASLYAGSIDITGEDITQGSYNDQVPKSYFTHWGGGAVDISVYDKSGERWRIKEEEIASLLGALRVVGFAAWYRPPDYEGNDSPAHIHAIAIGDKDLSREAFHQVVSSCGYFLGNVGIPILENECRYSRNPMRDEYGGPIVCDWMCELGYEVLRNDLRCKKTLGVTYQ